MHTWTIYEPSWWKTFMLHLNNLASVNNISFDMISLCADVVVFFFPIILLSFYIYWYRYKLDLYKKGSIKILLWIIISIAITMVIQQFITKDRPETLPWLQLILAHVPTMSFPSDHATVWFAMSVGTIFFGSILKKYLNNNKVYYLSIVLLILVILMVLSRVAVAVHWTTDIIAWSIVWILWAYISYRLKLFDKISYLISNTIDKILSIFWKV